MPSLDLPFAIVEPVHIWPSITSNWREGILLRGLRSGFPRYHPGGQQIPRRWRLLWPDATLGQLQIAGEIYRERGVYGTQELDWEDPSGTTVKVLADVFEAIGRDHDLWSITMELEELR